MIIIYENICNSYKKIILILPTLFINHLSKILAVTRNTFCKYIKKEPVPRFGCLIAGQVKIIKNHQHWCLRMTAPKKSLNEDHADDANFMVNSLYEEVQRFFIRAV